MAEKPNKKHRRKRYRSDESSEASEEKRRSQALEDQLREQRIQIITNIHRIDTALIDDSRSLNDIRSELRRSAERLSRVIKHHPELQPGQPSNPPIEEPRRLIDYQRPVPETVQSGCELRRSAERLSQIIRYHPGLQPIQNRPHIDPPTLQPTFDSPRFNLHAEGSIRLLPSNSNLSFLGAPPISKRYLRAQIRPIPFNLYSPAAPRLIPRIFQPTFQAPRFPTPQTLTNLHYPPVNPLVITYQPTESITSIVTSFPGQPLRDNMAQQGGAQPEGNQHPPVLNIGAARCQPRTFSNDPTRGESWLVFRVHFNHVAKLNDWTPRQARYYLASCMVGEAAQAVLHIPTEVTNAVADTLEHR